jgi:hypothetical protein
VAAAAVLSAAVIITFVFAPVVTDSWYGTNPRGPIFRYTAQVSPSYYLFGCGVVVNIHYSVNGGPANNTTHGGWWCG